MACEGKSICWLVASNEGIDQRIDKNRDGASNAGRVRFRALEECSFQHYGVIVLRIARTEDECDRPFAGQLQQFVNLSAMVLELGHVSPLEFLPATDIVAEPTP